MAARRRTHAVVRSLVDDRVAEPSTPGAALDRAERLAARLPLVLARSLPPALAGMLSLAAPAVWRGRPGTRIWSSR